MSTAHKSGSLGALTLGALGVVFGDIGTSPIYALRESLDTAGTELYDIYGVVSMIFWSLMLVVTLKYLVFVLRADNNGEGGILSLSLLCCQARFVMQQKALNTSLLSFFY